MSTGLLPSGCYDVLPPQAGAEAALASALIQRFEQCGYALVAPPLLEYTDSMLLGRGASLSPQILRVMDPHTNRVMGLRADMTLQLGRIAATRLKDAPRPLRLSYVGNVLRLQASSLEPNRQLRQIGLEQIGAGAKAEAEVVFIALNALTQAGIKSITVDLHYPAFTSSLLAEGEAARADDAIAQKDVAALARMQLTHGDALIALVQSAGNAKDALKRIASFSLPPHAAAHFAQLSSAVEQLAPLMGEAKLTLDVTERRGFDYYTGLSFSFFAQGAAAELGRGGRYCLGEEEAVGCSFFAEHLRGLLPQKTAQAPVAVALEDVKKIEKLLAEGASITLV